MSLFNEYQNKNFTFLTRYIIGAIDGNFDAQMTPEKIKGLLVGAEKLTYEDISEELSNQKDTLEENAVLFCPDDNGNLLPICNNPLPIRTTMAERAWLYYYLQKPEAKLFLDDETINILNKALSHNAMDYPLNDNTFVIKEISTEKEKHYSSYNILNFRTFLKAIHEKRYIITDNKALNGTIYKDKKLIPFRFEYSRQTHNMCVSVYDPTEERSIKLNLLKVENTRLGEAVDHYEEYEKKYLDFLNIKYETVPLTIKISDHYNGFDRTTYTFANFKRESFRDDDGNIIMNVYYRKFQSKAIIDKLLFLGSAVTILEPQNIIDTYLNIIKETLKNYS